MHVPVKEDQRQKALATYESFLASVWSQEARFMNYLEGLQFAKACANVVAQKAENSTKKNSAHFYSPKRPH
jgi:hypothetical protein